jgi:phosphoribosylformimino-5-aminoimidazole carboxamide ribotide isomerase
MIKVIPAITIQGGKIVKSLQGDIDQIKVYDKNPLDLAMELENNGFKRLHLIDLDGATQRKVVNYKILEMITKYTKLEVDFTGGITTDGDVRTVFEFGAKYITTASVPVHEAEKFKSWLITYGGNKIILAADSKDGMVFTSGWKKQTGIELDKHLDYWHERGVRYVKATEIARDGSMLGPNFDLYKNIRTKFPDLKLLASGGVRSVEDIEKLDELGVYAVILSRSIYEGSIKLEELQKFNA